MQASLDRVYTPVGPGGKVLSEQVIASGCIWSLWIGEAVAFSLFRGLQFIVATKKNLVPDSPTVNSIKVCPVHP